jgi:hypothetical protein
MSYPQQQQQQERRRRSKHPPRSKTSVIATTAATAAVAYGTYRLAQWYLKDDDDNKSDHEEEEEEEKEGIQRPLEEDLPSFFSSTEHQQQNQQQQQHSSHNNNNNYSWLSTAAIGAADWLLAGNSPQQKQRSRSPRSGSSKQQVQVRLTRRQQLVRCRYQTKIAFRTCFPTLKPIIEKLTDSSIQTKELKSLRLRRCQITQKLKQEKEDEEEKKDGNGNDNNDIDTSKHEHEIQELQQQEEELWCEILVETTTRMMVSSYAYALLLMSLTVQFHWLTSQHQGEAEAESMLMRSHQYLLNEGLPLLVSTVRRSVEEIFFNDDDDDDNDDNNDGTTSSTTRRSNTSSYCWKNPSTQFVTCKEIEQTLYLRLPCVLDDVGGGGRGASTKSRRSRRSRRRNWIRFILPDEESFDPMWDIYKSPVWEDAQEQVLESLWYKNLRDGNNNNDGWGKLFLQPKNGNSNGNDDLNQRKPLAKAMAQFKKASSALFEDVSISKNNSNNDDDEDGKDDDVQGETTIGKLQILPTLLELGDVSFQ